MHHPLSSDGRRPEPNIDLRTHLESLSPGHDHVCERLKPEHGIYDFVGNSDELRYSNPKASPEIAAGFEPITALWWRRLLATSCISRQFRERDGGWIQARVGPASRVRGRSTRSSFTSPPKEFR